MAHVYEGTGVPFSFFVSLIHNLSKIRPTRVSAAKTKRQAPLDVLGRWILELHKKYGPLPAGTTGTFFRFLFPEDDVCRKYGMKETALGQAIVKNFGLGERAAGLKTWSETSACLGFVVQQALEATNTLHQDAPSQRSMAQIDALLDELAANSAWSADSIRNKQPSSKRRARDDILQDLYYGLIPLDACVVTQILLKDIRPIAYPVPELYYTENLLEFNSASISELTMKDTMLAWDLDGSRRLLNIYNSKAIVGIAAKEWEAKDSSPVCPSIGVPVQIPKAQKGQGCVHALSSYKSFGFCNTVHAETKYDGERAQIHVSITGHHKATIQIFSKSKRDSTSDRYGVHQFIRQALGLSPLDWKPQFKKSVILEAEMVAFSSSRGCVDEFWRIRSLVATTSRGVRSTFGQPGSQQSQESHGSMMSDADGEGSRRLALVFFEVLMVDDTSFIWSPYTARRKKLESLIDVSHGETMLAKTTPIVLRSDGRSRFDEAEEDLRSLYADAIATCEEGLVIKGGGAYNWHTSPWVKIKKDYIPGYGDCLDLVVIGARWEKGRARLLRVNGDTYTTFYLGALGKSSRSGLPHFEVHFTVEYGLTREQLDDFNWDIKNSPTIPYRQNQNDPKLKYTYNVSGTLAPPTIMLCTPLLAELYGGGFDKPQRSKHYALRWPRFTKIHRDGERDWTECTTLVDLHKTACKSIGRQSSKDEAEAYMRDLFDPLADKDDFEEQKQREAKLWERKLEEVDSSDSAAKKRGRMMDMGSPQPLKRRKTDVGPAVAPMVDTPPLHRRVNSSPALGAAASPFTPAATRMGPPLTPATTPPTVDLRRILSKSTFRPSLLKSLARSSTRTLAKQPTPSATPVVAKPATSLATPPSEPQRRPKLTTFVFELKAKEEDLTMDEIPGSSPTPAPRRTQSMSEPKIPRLAVTSTLSRSQTLPVLKLESVHSDLNPAFINTSIVQFMWKAYIWVEPNFGEKSSRPPRKEILSKNHIQSFRNFLLGLGWDKDNKPATWVDRGVVFVDSEEFGKDGTWATENSNLLRAKRDELDALGKEDRLPIYIFDIRLLDYAELGMADQEDVGSKAICVT